MKTLKKEMLKDTIIDFIYDYCYNEKVQILEVEGIKLTIDPTQKEKLMEDKVIKGLTNEILHSKGPISMKYSSRNEDYCRIADNISVKSNFLDRLERIGIERKHIRMTDIEKAIQFLNNRSYVSKNAPINYELTLTKKGLQHYENGLSFEQNYRDKFLVRQANTISFISIIIAIASLIASFVIN